MLFARGEPDQLARRYYRSTLVFANTLTVGVILLYVAGANVSYPALVVAAIFHGFWLVMLVSTGHSANLSLMQGLVSGAIAAPFLAAVFLRSHLVISFHGPDFIEFAKLTVAVVGTVSFLPIFLVAGVSAALRRRSQALRRDV